MDIICADKRKCENQQPLDGVRIFNQFLQPETYFIERSQFAHLALKHSELLTSGSSASASFSILHSTRHVPVSKCSQPLSTGSYSDSHNTSEPLIQYCHRQRSPWNWLTYKRRHVVLGPVMMTGGCLMSCDISKVSYNVTCY